MPNLTQIINKEVQYLEPQQLRNLTKIYDYIFNQNNDLIYVQLPSSLKRLERYCFRDCYNLCYVEFPEGLTTISTGCFQNCISLNNVVLPSTVTLMNQHIFSNCSRLSNVNSSKVPWDCKLTGRMFDGTALADNTDGLLLFANDKIALQYCNRNYEPEVYIPETVKRVAPQCFYFYSSNTGGIESIAIPKSVMYLETSSFAHQPLLSTVDIGENVSKIKDYAFDTCDSLSTLIFRQPSDFKLTIGDSAFYTKSATKNITIYTDNEIVKKYDWKSKNYNATIYPLADYTGGNA